MSKRKILYTLQLFLTLSSFSSLIATDIPLEDIQNQGRPFLERNGNTPIRFQENDKNEKKGRIFFKQENKEFVTDYLAQEGYDVDFKYTSYANYVRLFDKLQTMRQETNRRCREFIYLRHQLGQPLRENFQEYIPALRNDHLNDIYQQTNPKILNISREKKGWSLREKIGSSLQRRKAKNDMIDNFNSPNNIAGGCQLDKEGTSASNFAKLYLILEAEKSLMITFNDHIVRAQDNIRILENEKRHRQRNIHERLRTNGEQIRILNEEIQRLHQRLDNR